MFVASHLCNDSQICVHWTGGILLDTNDGETKGGLQLRMSHMSLVHPQSHGSDEPLKLGRLSGEVVSNKSDLGHHPLPAFPLGLARFEDLENFCF